MPRHFKVFLTISLIIFCLSSFSLPVDAGGLSCPKVIAIVGKGGAGKGLITRDLLRQIDLVSLSIGEELRKRSVIWEERGRPGIDESDVLSRSMSFSAHSDPSAFSALRDDIEAYLKSDSFLTLSGSRKADVISTISFIYRNLLNANVPAAVADPIIVDFIASVPREQGLILDGSPRRIEQLNSLDTILPPLNRKLDLVFYLEASDNTVIQRKTGRLICRDCQFPFHDALLPPRKRGYCDYCGGTLYRREDDTKEAAQTLISHFQRDTIPLINSFESRGILRRIDAEQNPEKVLNDVLKYLP